MIIVSKLLWWTTVLSVTLYQSSGKLKWWNVSLNYTFITLMYYSQLNTIVKRLENFCENSFMSGNAKWNMKIRMNKIKTLECTPSERKNWNDWYEWWWMKLTATYKISLRVKRIPNCQWKEKQKEEKQGNSLWFQIVFIK